MSKEKCLALSTAIQVSQINIAAQAARSQGNQFELQAISPEICAGCGSSDPVVNEAMVDAEVAVDGLLKVVVKTVSGSCPQATG